MTFHFLLLITIFTAPPLATAATIATIFNNQPRLDINGKYIDAHDGTIVAAPINGTTIYFLYGEFFGNITGGDYPSQWSQPLLAVYTSKDMMNWTFHGNPVPSSFQNGVGWIPSCLYDPRHQRFVLWYGCGYWCVCSSYDGIHFENCTVQYSRFGQSYSTDGTGLFVDEDGQGYIMTSIPDMKHSASIELLTPDYLASTKKLIAGPFPIEMVENSVIFKHRGEYYVGLSSCCCACADGSGLAIFWSAGGGIAGPWKQQYPVPDINCLSEDTALCGDFSSHADELLWKAQWAHVSSIPLANGDTALVMVGRRWLSGPDAPSYTACPQMCGTDPGCIAPKYRLATDFDVWQRLNFSADGHVQRMDAAQTFELVLP